MKRFLWVLLALFFPVGAFAIGDQYGRITGIVYSPEGAEMPEAKITITSFALIGGPRVLYSSEDGSFTFNNLPPGKYNLSLEKEGFRTVQFKNLIVSVGKTGSLYITVETLLEGEDPLQTNERPLLDTSEMTFSPTEAFLDGEPSFWPEDTVPLGLFSWDLPMVGQDLSSFLLQLPEAKTQDGQLRLQGRPASLVVDGFLIPANHASR